MYEPEPRISLYLGSRATQVSDMAEAVFWAIDEEGLRLPSRRAIARHSRVSEATVSRRLRDSGSSEERLVGRLVKARARTYPPGYVDEGWARWLPATVQDLQDTRAWVSCLALASHSPAILDEVLEAWDQEQAQLVRQLEGTADDETQVSAEILRAVVLGLTVRRSLDPQLSHDHALALVERVVAALRPTA